MMKLLGLDIGGTKTAVILGESCEDTLSVTERSAFPTNASQGVEDWFDRTAAAIDELLSRHGVNPNELSGIGVSCGGPLDAHKGLIQNPPNLPGWDNVPITALLEERFGVRARLQNDADACALAEWRYGAARGTSHAVFLTFGTGMGAGLILNGALYTGANGMAGEVGHIRLSGFGPVGYGKSGSFEGFCSGGGIRQLGQMAALSALQSGEPLPWCRDAKGLSDITAQVIAGAAADGEPAARRVFQECGRQLGQGLAVLMDILNPEIIVLGSIFARCENLLRERMEQVLKQEALAHTRNACRVVPAALGESIGDYAALTAALYEHPLG